MRGNIYFYWILIVVVLYLASYVECFFFGNGYNKEFYYKNVCKSRALSFLILILGIIINLVFYFVKFTEWFFNIKLF